MVSFVAHACTLSYSRPSDSGILGDAIKSSEGAKGVNFRQQRIMPEASLYYLIENLLIFPTITYPFMTFKKSIYCSHDPSP